MFDIERWREIWASISNNKLRTFLSGATIALALFVFITLFGLSKGLQNGFEIEFFPPNAKSISIYGGRTTIAYKGNKEGREITLDLDDYKFVKDSFSSRIKYILPRYSKGLIARNFSEYGNYTLVGTTSDMLTLNDSKMTAGRYFDAIDGERLDKNVVIGRLVKEDLFKNTSAIGKEIQLGNTLFKVIGVFSDEDGDDEERMIYMPIETMQVIYGTTDINDITIIPNDDLPLSGITELSQNMETALKNRLIVHPDDSRGVSVWDPSEGLETTDMFFFIFTIIVFFIGIGSLVAGIVSIGNMMIFGVKERTKEIGIRKALGAKPSGIIALILQEAFVITFLFGIAGILLAILFTNLIKDSLTKYLIIEPTVSKEHIILATIILLFSGLMAGFIPARRAAKIKPIEALRNE